MNADVICADTVPLVVPDEEGDTSRANQDLVEVIARVGRGAVVVRLAGDRKVTRQATQRRGQSRRTGEGETSRGRVERDLSQSHSDDDRSLGKIAESIRFHFPTGSRHGEFRTKPRQADIAGRLEDIIRFVRVNLADEQSEVGTGHPHTARGSVLQTVRKEQRTRSKEGIHPARAEGKIMGHRTTRFGGRG